MERHARGRLRALTAIALVACCAPDASIAAPPSPHRLALDFQARCPQLSGSPDTLAALEELFNRTQSLPDWEPLKVTAATSELRTFISLAGRGAEIEIVPSSPARGRSPAAVIRIPEHGVVRETRVEIKSVIGRHVGKKPRGGFGRGHQPRPADVRDIMRALRSGYKETPTGPSQLGNRLVIDGRVIPPGGKLVIQLPRGTNTPTAVADAMRRLAARMQREGRHVHEVEFHHRDRQTRQWTIERYVRRPGGTYGQVALERPDGSVAPCPEDKPQPPQPPPPPEPEQPPERPAGADPDPSDAVRSAIGAAVTDGPGARPPDEPPPSGAGAPAAPVLASQGGGRMASTGSLSGGRLGGVDFSSGELRYVSDVSMSRPRAAGFAFRALPGKGAGTGLRAAQRASEAFFVWLALPPRSFTVNLNPDDPASVIDARFGQTNAGRVLLEADLRMKKTVGRLIHPD